MSSMDSGDCETEEDSAPEACVSPEGPLLPSMYGQGYNVGGGAFNINWYPPPSQQQQQQAPPPPMHHHHQQQQQQQQLLRGQSFPPQNSGYIMEPPPSNSREMRNRAEKMRRDKLNAYIGELATLVPMVARSAKRMDKTSILRLTATHLRIYQTLLNQKQALNLHLPKQVDQSSLEQLVCEQLKGFLMILTATGKIVFVSYTVEHLLGHLQTDLMGQSIFNLISPDDAEKFRMYINPVNEISDSDFRKYFNLHLKRAGPRNEVAVYELVNIMGMQRPTSATAPCTSSRDISTTSPSNDLWIFFVRVLQNESPNTHVLEANDEYVTRHLVDGRIINCDQRISFIAGYMKEEVSGLSAFKFMHREDVRWVMIALRQMYDRGETRGYSCYRLLSRTGQFIYLRTTGILEVDSTGTVESFICVNTLVTEKEGEDLIKQMKDKYSALIKNCNSLMLTNSSATNDKQCVDDPQQLEAAIAHLIEKLPSPDSDSESTLSPTSVIGENVQDYSTETNHSTGSSCPYYLKVKTVKRPPNLMSPELTSSKRHKSSPIENIDCSPRSQSSFHITDPSSDNR